MTETSSSSVTANAQTIDFNAIFDAYMASNQKTWAHDRNLTVGASEVFGCLREVWFKKRGKLFGYEPDEGKESWGALERGNIIENNFVVPAMKFLPKPFQLLLAGDDQYTFVLDKNSATPDGLIINLDPSKPLIIKGAGEDIVIDDIGADCVVFEIKSIDPRATLFEERAKHHGQTQVQLGLIRELTEYKPLYSIILYIDASFIDKLTPFVVEYDPDIFAAAKHRALSVWQVSDPMMIVPEGKFDGACEYCKFQGACGEATVNAVKAMYDKPADPKVVEEVAPLVDTFFAKKAAAEAADQELKNAAERVKEFLLDHRTRRVPGDDWSISWSIVKGKTSLDTDAMKEAGIDLAKFQKTGAAFERLTITRKAKPKT